MLSRSASLNLPSRSPFLLALLACVSPLCGGPLDDIGVTALRQARGSTLPDGTNVSITVIEAITNGAWAPETKGELTGKSITYLNAYTGYATHAYEVVSHLSGSTRGVLPKMTHVSTGDRSTYGIKSLAAGKTLYPAVVTWDIENHSWGGDFNTSNVQFLQRVDYRVNRDRVIVVSGVNNGSSSTLSPVIANMYNGITVGLSSGNHARSGSTQEGAGRQKPDIVAPMSQTSWATPLVAGTAGLLVSEIKRTPALALARHPAVVKALVLAGATKSGLARTWSATAESPLDKWFGVGQLNTKRSYELLLAGRAQPGVVGPSGWDLNQTTATGTRRVYEIEVAAGQTLTLSAVLTWNREILATGTNWNTSAGATYSGTTYAQLAVRMPNLDLHLWRVDPVTGQESLVSRSASPVDNVEHVYKTDLPSGLYRLEVLSPLADFPYACAWRGDLSGTALPPLAPASTTPTPAPAPTPTPAPEPLLAADTSLTGVNVGAVVVPGSVASLATAGSFTVTGAGEDFLGWRDVGFFATTGKTGDHTLVARIDGVTGGTKPRAGLGWRDSASENSVQVSIVVSPGGALSVVARRSSSGTADTLASAAAGKLPVWLRLTRTGGSVAPAYSLNGTTWVTLPAVTVPLSAGATSGLVTWSGSNTGVTTSHFSSLAVP